MTQYYSRTDIPYAGDSNFTIPFSYIDKNDIHVYINDTLISTWVWLNDSQIDITSTLQAGDVVSIRRITPIDEKIVTYQNMSMVLSDDNLNLSQDQVLNAVQEVYDNNVSFQIDVNAQIDEIDTKVDTANTTANQALSNSETAISIANEALSNSEDAVLTANTAETKADNAVSTANTASTNASQAVSTANEANTNAQAAVSTANSAADDASEALTKANTAISTANTAKDTADTAKDTADEALADSATALANSETAINTANDAVDDATEAVATANTANTNASNAVSTANSASSAANSAVSTANSAATAANNAVSTANTASTNASTAIARAEEAIEIAQTAVSQGLTPATTTTLGGIKVGDNLSITADGTLSADAQNIEVDDELSTTSENPVQNKVITGALDEKQDTLINGDNVYFTTTIGLPQSYTEIVSVTNAANTYVDTGVRISADNAIMEMRFKVTSSSASGSFYLWQQRSGTAGNILGLSGSASGSTIAMSVNGSSVVSDITRVAGHTYFVRATYNSGNGTLYVKDETTGTEATNTGTYTFALVNKNLHMFGNGLNSSQTAGAGITVDYAKLTVNGTKTFEACFAKNSSNTVGIYDTVNRAFRTAGLGSLTAGDDSNKPKDVIYTAGFLKNTATREQSLTINGTASTQNQSINIGMNSAVSSNLCVALGFDAQATKSGGVAVGYGSRATGSGSCAYGYFAKATANYAIQIGNGTNATASTLAVGFNGTNYRLLDGTTGKIPSARLNTLVGADGTNAGVEGIVPAPTATDNTKFLRGDGTWANVDSLPSQTGQSGKFLTTDGTDASWSNLTIPTVDQTYDATSTNAQSGVAIAGAGFVESSDLEEVHCVVETYINGTSWYRVYSDGWCEQGGQTDVSYSGAGATKTVTLLKPYTNTNYDILLSMGGQAYNGVANCNWQNKTASNFVIYGDYTDSTASLPTYWQACGYIEV